MMNAKEYLKKAGYLDQLINEEIEQVEMLNNLATKATTVYSDTPKSPNRNTDRMEQTICKIIDLEMKINSDIDKLVDLKREISECVQKLESSQEQLLIKYRYMDMMSWEDISRKLCICERQVHRLHASALRNFPVPN